MQTLLRPQVLRYGRPLVHRTVRFSRRYNGFNNTGPHTTYFQPPPEPPKPRRRWLRSTVFSVFFIGLGALGNEFVQDYRAVSEELEVLRNPEAAREAALLDEVLKDVLPLQHSLYVPAMTLDAAQDLLESKAAYQVSSKAVAHVAQLGSNMPCEDAETSGAYTILGDPKRDWSLWGIFDGHAGPRTARFLRENLSSVVGSKLQSANVFTRRYVPNDFYITTLIKQAFTDLDRQILDMSAQVINNGTMSRAQTIAVVAPVFSGSCALLALFDPSNLVLRVANVGDSRAVLGRWDSSQEKYVAQQMSVDQTGFNREEVERMARDHPDEDVIDPKTGRVHGIAVSRAFGDARWKWPQEVSKRARDLFWGPSPRPDHMIKTPPYLTAEPEVKEIQIQEGDHPDFLIMASDGLWDQMSSQDAVTCVQMWLDKYAPTDFLRQPEKLVLGGPIDPQYLPKRPRKSEGEQKSAPLFLTDKPPRFSTPAELAQEEEDVFYNEEEKTVLWRTSPKHFVVEDECCGVHLIKNALGGNRRNLFMGLMTVQAPLSRNVRDDITVQVVFFGTDAEAAVKAL